MIYNPTVDLGTILQIVAFLITGVTAYFGIVRRMDRMEIENRAAHANINEKLTTLWNHFLKKME